MKANVVYFVRPAERWKNDLRKVVGSNWMLEAQDRKSFHASKLIIDDFNSNIVQFA